FFCFFFSSRRRHTRFDCDWSSDVCSSDLRGAFQLGHVYYRMGTPNTAALEAAVAELEGAPAAFSAASGMGTITAVILALAQSGEIGRASCRERVEISVGAGT